MCKLNKKEIEKIVVDLLTNNPMELTDIVDNLFYSEAIPEFEVKEAVLRLRYKGTIEPNNKWEMTIITDNIVEGVKNDNY